MGAADVWRQANESSRSKREDCQFRALRSPPPGPPSRLLFIRETRAETYSCFSIARIASRFSIAEQRTGMQKNTAGSRRRRPALTRVVDAQHNNSCPNRLASSSTSRTPHQKTQSPPLDTRRATHTLTADRRQSHIPAPHQLAFEYEFLRLSLKADATSGAAEPLIFKHSECAHHLLFCVTFTFYAVWHKRFFVGMKYDGNKLVESQ